MRKFYKLLILSSLAGALAMGSASAFAEGEPAAGSKGEKPAANAGPADQADAERSETKKLFEMERGKRREVKEQKREQERVRRRRRSLLRRWGPDFIQQPEVLAELKQHYDRRARLRVSRKVVKGFKGLERTEQRALLRKVNTLDRTEKKRHGAWMDARKKGAKAAVAPSGSAAAGSTAPEEGEK